MAPVFSFIARAARRFDLRVLVAAVLFFGPVVGYYAAWRWSYEYRWEIAVLLILLSLFCSALLATAMFRSLRRQYEQRTAQANLALRQSEERLALAERVSSDGIWDWNLLSGEVFYSPRFEELLGCGLRELDNVFDSFKSRMHAGDQARTLLAIEAHLQQRAPFDVECRLRVKSGDYRWFHCLGKATWDAEGEAIRMSGSITDVTQQKQAKESLAALNDRMQAVLDAATQVAIIATDMAGVITVFNTGAERMLKYRAEDLVGRKTPALIHLESEVRAHGERLTQEFGRPIEGFDVFVEYARRGGFEEREWTYVRQDGSQLTVDVVVTAVQDRSGAMTGFLEIAKDTTESKRVQAALKQEQYLLHTLLELLPDSIYFKDMESRFVRVSQALAKKFGLSDASDAVGRCDFDFFTREHAEKAQADEQRLIRTKRPLLGLIERETWPDGRSTWVATSKLPLRDAHGKIIGSFGISRDITEQKRAEERFRLAVEASPNALVMVDRQGKIILVNSQTETLFGYERSEVQGQSVELLLPTRFRDSHVELRRQYFHAPENRAMGLGRNLYGLREDGSEFPMEVRLSPIETEEGLMVLATVVDITTRKKAEDALRQAKDTAEAASRAKSVFLANMSHEIRTPMNAIIGMTELVLDTQLAIDQREYLAMVLEAGESLLSIINEILDFSKIEAGKIELEDQSFKLRESLGDTMKLLALRAHRKGLELAYHVAADVPEVLQGDAGRLRQIVVNLLGNAIKFTDRGEVVLDVFRAEETDHAVTLHFTVTDTGVGIPPDKHVSIFQAFEQADNSTTRRYGGTGLGLAISSRLATLMGGRIWVESEVGRGSTFHFTACLAVGTNGDAAVAPALPPDLNGLPVLIVDDNSTNRRILAELLTNWRMKPTTASGVVEALRELRTAEQSGQPFSLIISDMHMPDYDGFSLAGKIQQEPEHTRPIIMMLSSGDAVGDRERSHQLGIAAYLVKPIKPSELLESIQTAMVGSLPASDASRAVEPTAVVPSGAWSILLAEDSLVNQKLAVALLTSKGHDVTVVNNGQEAAAAVKAKKFDLVLMDVQMPVMDGLQATELIRADEYSHGKHVPIIALTAHAMKGDRERCLEAGMDGYVTKPIHAHDLFATIYQVLGQGKSLVAQEAPHSPTEGDGVFNIQQALEAFGGKRALLQTVATAYREESPRLLREIHSALERQEATTVYRLAHTLKGNSRIFGANSAADVAQRVEELARAANLSEAATLLPPLEQQIAAVCEALSEFVAADD